MLTVGDRVPDVVVWNDVRSNPVTLREAIGDGLVLLCFYLFDWSPT